VREMLSELNLDESIFGNEWPRRQGGKIDVEVSM
jgi:hypothetical protein